MNRSNSWNVATLIAVLGLGAYPALAQIPLPTRTVQPSAETSSEFLKALKASGAEAMHGLATFRWHPTAEERKNLEASGVRVLTPLLGTTYRVRVALRTDSRALARSRLQPKLVQISAQDRVHPRLWREEFSAFVVKPPGRNALNYVLNADATLNLSVRVHAGVPEAESGRVMQKHARRLHREGRQTWVAVVPRASLRALAEEDIVQWIGAGPLPFLPENDLMRAAINVDLAQDFNETTGQVRGLGGKGVQVGVFDKGVDETHRDFEGDSDADGDGVLDSRVKPNHAGAQYHATHLAGIIAGNGKLSTGVDSLGSANCVGAECKPYRWRGMAPSAGLIDIDQLPPFGQNGKNPDTHMTYISGSKMDLSNHSYVFSVDGTYNDSDQARDEIIRGDAFASDGSRVPARLHVTSAGNNGQSAAYGHQKGYFALTKQVKNALVVGSWDHAIANPRIAEASSLGPAHDGRIKPDVVAPGGNIRSTGVCSTDEDPLPAFCKDASDNFVQRQNFYRLMRGTSMASAAATGALALVLEQFASTYGMDLDTNPPLPSTLRAVMIQTAGDKHSSPAIHNDDCPGSTNCVVDTPGPDFVTGWGLIDANAAVIAVASQLLQEGSVTTTCDSRTFFFTVPPGTTDPVRVTLAWDDPAADALPDAVAATAPTLRNDLDLVLIDPNGTEHYPWQLNQDIVDSAGNTIPSAMQHCGTSITVKRQWMPVADPVSANDTIPPGGIPKAVRGGRDHLNNVEVVEVEAAAVVAGTWQARVTAFVIAEGPQRFSIVGKSFGMIPVSPYALCHQYPVLCQKLAMRVDLCKRYPKLCEPRMAFPAPGRIRVVFDDPRQKIALPLDRICQYAVNCPGCGSNALCPGYKLRVESPTAPIRVEVYSANGRLMGRDASAKQDKRLALHASPGEQYFLVFSPLPGTRPGTELELSLSLN